MQQESVIKGDVIVSGGVITDGCIVIRDGVIQDILRSSSLSPTNDYSGYYIAPGYIDLHIHGILGADTMDGTPESIRLMAEAVLRHGVTSFLPTTVTQSLDATERAIHAVRQVMEEAGTSQRAQILGLHLEGPWISKQAKGAQNEQHIVNPQQDSVLRTLDVGRDIVRIVTIAPELTGSAWAMNEFLKRGIAVSIGHTTASYEDADAAISAGARRITHCFNAMTGLHHRKPGVVGAALLRDDVSTELIADGHHVHPAVMKLMYKVKGAGRLMLVTDSMRAADMPEGGNYELGGQLVTVEGGQARLADGSLAGSVLTMDVAVQNMVRLCGVTVPDAVAMASATPAESIGIGDHKGRLAPGFDADIVVLDRNLRPVHQIVSNRR